MKLSKEELHERYWVQGQSCVDIGRDVGRDPKTVHSWMKSYGLGTRGRGHNKDQQFGKGKPIPKGWHHSEATKEKLRQARIADGSKGLFKPNGDHVLKGRRGEEIHSWKGGVTPERQAFCATDEWKAAVAEVRRRTGDTCERCGVNNAGESRSFHAHHIASFMDAPDRRADPDNLKWLCAPCHRWVHSAANADHQFLEVRHEEA